MRETLVSFLDQFSTRRNDPAVACLRGLRMERWSYGRLAEVAHRFSNLLEEMGIGKGDRVIFWGENGPEWVSAFYGCLARGVVVVPLDPQSLPSFVMRVRQQVEARLILCDRQFSRQLDGTMPELLFDELTEKVADCFAEPRTSTDIQPDDLVEIIFTSGTTAEPKVSA